MTGITTIKISDKTGEGGRVEVFVEVLYQIDKGNGPAPGFDPASPSHQAGSDLLGLFDQIATPVDEKVNLSAAQIMGYDRYARERVEAGHPAPTAAEQLAYWREQDAKREAAEENRHPDEPVPSVTPSPRDAP